MSIFFTPLLQLLKRRPVHGVLELLARCKTAVEALDIVGRHRFGAVCTVGLDAKAEGAEVAQVNNVAGHQFLRNQVQQYLHDSDHRSTSVKDN